MAQRMQQDGCHRGERESGTCERVAAIAIHPSFASRLTAQMSAHMTSWANHHTPIALRKLHAAVMWRCARSSSPQLYPGEAGSVAIVANGRKSGCLRPANLRNPTEGM